jgi:hypothetical protein
MPSRARRKPVQRSSADYLKLLSPHSRVTGVDGRGTEEVRVRLVEPARHKRPSAANVARYT